MDFRKPPSASEATVIPAFNNSFELLLIPRKKDVTFPMESYCNSLRDPIGAPHLGFGSARVRSLPKTSTPRYALRSG